MELMSIGKFAKSVGVTFANRLYGQKSKKTKQLIYEVKYNVDSKESQT